MRKLLLVPCVLLFQTVHAQWSGQSTVNTPVALAADMQYAPIMVTDGSGGSIVAWTDYRSGNGDVYVQRLNAQGVPQWTANGVAITNLAGDQYFPLLTADGAGGVYITWTDMTSGSRDIYAQRVNASGSLLWGATGVAVVNAANDQFLNDNMLFGSGLLVSWGDNRTSSQTDVYVQYLGADGSSQWTANGLLISNATREQVASQLLSDGAGGAVIHWLDYRNNNYDIYAQRINASGTALWAANGIAMATGSYTEINMQLVNDGSGGFVGIWEDARNGALNADLFAQRFNSNGTPQWAAGGIAVAVVPESQNAPRVISDGAGGMIAVWHDQRNGNRDLYAQRITVGGVAAWTANGVPISIAAGNQTNPKIISDGSNGAMITWDDERSGASTRDIYAQRINSSGTVQWTVNGVVVSDATNSQQAPVLVGNGAGSAIVVWTDSRNDVGDLYAALLHPGGTLPVTWLSFDGYATINGNELSWSTANETGNDHFDIEKLSNGAFKKIAAVQSAGTRVLGASYAFTDRNPGGDDMYRLRQVNKDGSFSFSKTVRIINRNAAGVAFENRVHSSMNISTSLRGRLEISDMQGRVIMSATIRDQQTTIYTGGLPAGRYMLTLGSFSGSFIKI